MTTGEQIKNLFFSPEIWREFIKPNEEKYVKRIHDHGMLYIHHSCGNVDKIIPELAEIGIDAWNRLCFVMISKAV